MRALTLCITVLLLVPLAHAGALDWLTGAATGPNYASVLLFVGDEPVGTANPFSEGRERAVLAGETLRISVQDVRRSGDAVTGPATITIRHRGEVVFTNTLQLADGDAELLLTIPAAWSGNYHMTLDVPGDKPLSAQNEFKVSGFGCRVDEESCDGQDNDCDGIVDDIAPRNCGGSDVGSCQRGTQQCTQGFWSACEGLVEPDVERCDGQDNDCDGRTDEDITMACGSDVGACRQGVQRCDAGTFTSCEQSVGPSAESCNGIDDDCDGTTDEECGCVEGDIAQCGSEIGDCRAGTMRCVNGAWGVCDGLVEPDIERCDGVDNDCDGQIDESLVERCTVEGMCGVGVRRCEGADFGECRGGVPSSDEVCDGIDNDCDGQVDESLVRSCGANGCLRGEERCEDGRWGACSDISGPRPEICNGVDDNCDGSVDEALLRPCGCDCSDAKLLLLRAGLSDDDVARTLALLQQQHIQYAIIDSPAGGLSTQHLLGYDLVWALTMSALDATTLSTLQSYVQAGGALALSADDARLLSDVEAIPTPVHRSVLVRDATASGNGLVAVVPPALNGILPSSQAETIMGSLVNWLLNRAGRCACGIDTGQCRQSVQECTDGSWGRCDGVPPIHEVCNALDDDCDGTADNGVACECTDGSTESCGSSVGACSLGTRRCTGGSWGRCEGATLPRTETCNNIDDDCDGQVDESIVLACGASVTPPCQLGVQVCVDGVVGQCIGAINPQPERCDGVDNNCDGFVDENSCSCRNGETRPCQAGLGACGAGTQRCDGGNWGSCIGSTAPAAEQCNGLDDDCDGLTDENTARSCGATIGACSAGIQLCEGGAFGICDGGVGPAAEQCNGVDDDCDGLVDNGITCECVAGDTRACGDQRGVSCNEGFQRCEGGIWGFCQNFDDYHGVEICDGVDNDCDGQTDEELARACGQSDVGACTLGTQQCVGGAWGRCEGVNDPSDERCEDGIDNDCDGQADEDCDQPGGPIVVTSGPTSPASDVVQCDPDDQECGGRMSAQLELTILDAPRRVDANDNRFGVRARVRNVGRSVLPDVDLDAAASHGWQGETRPIGTLVPNQSRDVTLTFDNVMCPPPGSQPLAIPGSVVLRLDAYSGTIRDVETLRRRVDTPTIGLLASHDATTLRTCVLVNNPSSQPRRQLEIELELYDQTDDLLVDLITPVRVGANSTAMRVQDYPLRALRIAKPYRLRANLYENGSIFTDGYHVGEARMAVDLSAIQITGQRSLWDVVLDLLGVI